MKKTTYLNILISMALLFFNTGCKKEDDNTENTDLRDAMVGTWVCNEESQIHGPRTYVITISKDSNTNNLVLIENFYNIGLPDEYAQLQVNSNTLTMPQQIIAGYTMEGSGVFANNITMTIDYTVNDITFGNDVLSAMYTKTN